MIRLVATALIGYVAYRVAKEFMETVPDDFGSHLPQQHRRTRPKPAAARAKPRTRTGSTAKTA